MPRLGGVEAQNLASLPARSVCANTVLPSPQANATPTAPGKVAAKNGAVAGYTMAQVAEHCTREDLWIVVDGLVYDVTRYLDRHPGGWLPLVNMAGKDCTDVRADHTQTRPSLTPSRVCCMVWTTATP